MNGLVVMGLVRALGGRRVLEGLDLEVPRDGALALQGPTGCGKTTLLRTIAGLERLDEGSVAFGGRILSGPGVHLPPWARGIAMAFQQPTLWPHLDVAGNVAFAVAHLPRAERAARVTWALDLLGLSALARRHPSELSGGQARCAALARALAPGAPLLLLDEPLVHLDAASRDAARTALREARRQRPATLLLVTHDPAEAEALCDRILTLKNAAPPPGISAGCRG